LLRDPDLLKNELEVGLIELNGHDDLPCCTPTALRRGGGACHACEVQRFRSPDFRASESTSRSRKFLFVDLGSAHDPMLRHDRQFLSDHTPTLLQRAAPSDGEAVG